MDSHVGIGEWESQQLLSESSERLSVMSGAGRMIDGARGICQVTAVTLVLGSSIADSGETEDR